MSNWLTELFMSGFNNGMQNIPLLFVPAFVYATLCAGAALILGWGTILFDTTENGVVLKLPGGGLLAAPPIWESILLGLWLTQPAVSSTDWLVGQFLTFFFVLRVVLWALTHLLVFVGSHFVARGKQFSLECMDGRCSHGTRGGIFAHYWACGGFTLLTALGFAPLVPIAIWWGLPDGVLGMVLLAIFLFPYPLVVSKFLVKLVHNEAAQMVIKGTTDVLMISEALGLFVGAVTTSLVSFRPMIPGISPTRLH